MLISYAYVLPPLLGGMHCSSPFYPHNYPGGRLDSEIVIGPASLRKFHGWVRKCGQVSQLLVWYYITLPLIRIISIRDWECNFYLSSQEWEELLDPPHLSLPMCHCFSHFSSQLCSLPMWQMLWTKSACTNRAQSGIAGEEVGCASPHVFLKNQTRSLTLSLSGANT